MSPIIHLLAAALALLAPQDPLEKILEVRVNAPYHCIGKPIDLQVRELTTREAWAVENLPAGHPARFHIPPGRFLLRVSGEGIATGFAGPVELDDLEKKERLTVNLEKGARLSGIIRDMNGKPLEGVKVFLEGGSSLPYRTINPFLPAGLRPSVLWPNKDVMMAAVTNGEGRFLLDGIPSNKAGNYHIHLEKAVYRRAYRLPESSFMIRPGIQLEREWILERGEPSIIIELGDTAGHPVKEGWISWMDPRVSRTTAGFEDYVGLPSTAGPSGPDGRIEIIDPPPGIQDYWIVGKGYDWVELRASPGDVRKVELPGSSGRLEISVVDAEDGRPLPEARIQVKTHTLFQTPFEISPKEPGTFLVRGELKRFPLYIGVWSADCPSRHVALFLGPEKPNGFENFPFFRESKPQDVKERYRKPELEREARSGRIELELEKGIHFSVLVQGKECIPLDGFNALVSLQSKDSGYYGVGGRRLTITQTAPAEARIDVIGIEPGTLEILFSAPHYISGSKKFRIKKDGQEGVIQLTPIAKNH